MMSHWANLNEPDRAAFRATVAFLKGRLEKRETVDWALGLKPSDTIKRLAVLDLIDSPDGKAISEPWRSAWRLIEESWNNPPIEELTSPNEYLIQKRLREGERSGAIIAQIVERVEPRLKIEAFSASLSFPSLSRFIKKKGKVKKVEDLFSLGLTSMKMFDPDLLGLRDITDSLFLVSLARALDAAVTNGLEIARRIGWDGESRFWRLGSLYRAYYVPPAERPQGEHEPDEFHRGIAPSTKLLNTVVSRLVEVDISRAVEIVRRWKLTSLPVYMRLWASLSRNPRVTPADEIGSFFISLTDRLFWNVNDYPEIAELRAVRFSELDPNMQTAITAKIRRFPPRNQWPKKANADEIKRARVYWAVRELRRIEVAGAQLPELEKAWLGGRVPEFPDLAGMTRLDTGFLSMPRARWVQPSPDSRYNLISGEERLKSLESALSSERKRWEENNPAERATDWIRHPGNAILVFHDFESIPDGGSAFPRVWDSFGWTHSPTEEKGEAGGPRDLPAECADVLTLLAKLSEATIRQAIDGITHWFSTWEKQIVLLPDGLSVWLKLWPIAIDATNAQSSVEQEIHVSTISQPSEEREPLDLDTLNTPAGKLAGVFLEACPNLLGNNRPFDTEGAPRMMRDAISAASGRSSLIALHRLIEDLPYFLQADPDWTQEHLIQPLSADNVEAIALWRAIARHTHFTEVLNIIGDRMAERATDRRLGRGTRSSLVFSLVIECMYSFLEKRKPAVPYARIQQMLRSLDDEVRAYAAEALQRFVRDLSAPGEGAQGYSAEQLFRSAAAPFLETVWPQERSLATPGVSRALAQIPATAKDAFSEAVKVIERFLVPFECWSMLEYGLYGEGDGIPRLSNIDNQEKAAAFLRLLDLTIGTAEGAVVPYNLADALDQVRKVSINLAESQTFRRLATAARR